MVSMLFFFDVFSLNRLPYVEFGIVVDHAAGLHSQELMKSMHYLHVPGYHLKKKHMLNYQK